MAKDTRTIKIRSKFRTARWSYRRKLLRNLRLIMRHILPLAARYLSRRLERPDSFTPHRVGRDFFGINAAPSPSPELEEYHFERLRELGVTHVRTDYAYESNPEWIERWIDRLCDAQFDVLVHLVQPSEDASQMDEEARRVLWGKFLRKVMKRFAGKVRSYEIGSTPNRHSWSGYTIQDYVTTFSIAREIAGEFGVELIGPNVSDFAPYFLAALLAELRRAGIRLPFVSDNLFVDRAGQPENYDEHVLSRWLVRFHRLDLARKTYVLDVMARAAAMGPPICTYVYWTINPDPRKFRRRYVSEDGYANHMVRYFVYAAAAGHLRRVYWGQMSGFFKGIIDDGARVRFDPPAVYQRLCNAGALEDYRKRPAFGAFRVMVEQMSDTQMIRAWAIGERKAYVFEFEKEGRPLLVGWTKNGVQIELETVIPSLSIDRLIDRDGEAVSADSPVVLTEKPLYIHLATAPAAPSWSDAGF